MIANWSSMSQAERDAAYNNNGAVANSAELIVRRNGAAQAYRAAHPAGLDIPYGSGPRNKWDLFPATDASAPCLVFIHGGYWQRNSREDFSHLAGGIRAHGWSAALPSHTLAPDASLAEIVGELRSALDWLAKEGPRHGIAPRKLVVSGWSAGGHLTAMMLSHPSVHAGLAISGVYELAPIRDTGLNEKLQLKDAEIASLSPLRLPVVMKPLAVAYGSKDLRVLVGDARGLHALRSQHKAPGPLLEIAGADHFTILDELERPDGQLVKAALAI